MQKSVVWKYQIFLLMGVVTFIFLSYSWGSIPALGPLLSPFRGVWQNLPREELKSSEIFLSQLEKNVEVIWDEYGVPHIFAEDQKDLYFAQGYLVARDRLFQMDVSSRPGGARLSEMAGDLTRKMDRFFIKLGMRRSARRAAEEMLKDPQTRLAVEAYTEGVNAYINQLDDKELPPEYLILGIKPTHWTPLRTAEFLKTMAFNLAARSFDLYLTEHLQKFGWEKLEFLFPTYLKDEDYIFSNLKLKNLGSTQPVPEQFKTFTSEIKSLPDFFQPNQNQGSNNFAIGASKSQSGFPLLANDTHLGLSLPAVWYELQLFDKNHNVYGATFPGSPGVILGFNSELAWGVTNGTTDVLDWYEIEFKSENSLEYLVDGQWKLAEKEIEVLDVKNGASEEVEVLWTDFGVVFHRQGKLGWALRWTAHEASNELKAFLSLNHSSSFESCKESISYFLTPSQNFICMDKKQIGLWHQGLFPDRFANQGKFIMDGRKSENNWKTWIAKEDLPHVIDPEAGYVRSSNNMVYGAEYAHYLGWDYDESYRAKRIRQLIEAKEKLAPLDLIEIQNDVIDLHAQKVIPRMLNGLAFSKLNESQIDLVEKLKAWDFVARVESVETTFYKMWWNEFEDILFDEFGKERKQTYYPRRQRTAEILNETMESGWEEWIDVVSTKEKKETLNDLINKSFDSAWEKLNRENGGYGDSWRWGKARPTHFRHVARIPGFGANHLEVPGTRYSPRASTGDLGPTWKLVVTLGPELKAWSHIPGHNQGHPFSNLFEHYMQDWIKGEMKPVHFLSSLDEDLNQKLGSYRSMTLKADKGAK